MKMTEAVQQCVDSNKLCCRPTALASTSYALRVRNGVLVNAGDAESVTLNLAYVILGEWEVLTLKALRTEEIAKNTGVEICG